MIDVELEDPRFYPKPQITYILKDLYKEFIVRSPKTVGSLKGAGRAWV